VNVPVGVAEIHRLDPTLPKIQSDTYLMIIEA